MLRKLQGILIVATVCAGPLAAAHPVHYAMAVAGTKQASLAISETVYTALARDTATARTEAIAQCREATNRDCVVIEAGPLAHIHE